MESVVTLYENQFDPEEYLDSYYSVLDPEVSFFLRNLHEALEELRPEQKKILEIGCGPTITSILSATKWTSKIYMTDFLEKNLTEVKSFLSNAEKLKRWKPYVQAVADLEKISTENVTERLTRNVCHVGKCDVFGPRPALGLETQFDVILSTLCLEFVAVIEETYIDALRNIRNILTPGGVLILQGAVNNTYYDIKCRRFPSLRLEEATLREYLGKVGFEVRKYVSTPRMCTSDKTSDHTGCFYVMAKKV